MSAPLEEYLAFALQVALDAGRVAIEHYQTGVDVELKADSSPVTRADRGAEQLIRQAIARRYPDHSVVGEEYGADQRASAFRWIVDPIDGTKSFIRGVPLFGVLIALEIDGQADVGVCHMPALGETVAAATGLGCTWNGRRARASQVEQLTGATVVFSDGRMLARRLGDRWEKLESEAGLLRSWGDCYGHCLVATGRADVMLDPVMNAWDCAALLPIVRESGGRFSDWTGMARIDGGEAVSTNEALHTQVLELLRGA
jgi:histidinol-phosphatase